MSCQNQPPHPINTKKALFFPTALLRKPNSCDQQHTDYYITTNFLKYFPKYIHRLEIDVHTGPVISKVKRAKIIHSFRGYQNESQSRNLKRTLLYNKRRYIQFIMNESYPAFQYTKQFQEEVKAFRGLQALKLPQIYANGGPTQAEQLHSLKKICRSIKTHYKLRHLELQISSKSYLAMILKINKWERLLEFLKILKVECRWEIEDDHSLFEGLLRLKNILKFTTHLKLGCLKDQSFYELFENILACCPNLTSIWFETAKEESEDDSSDDEEGTPRNNYIPVYSQYLRALERLHHLQTVNITCRDVWTFLRDFTLPVSIQNIKLQFKSFDSSKFFEEDPNNLSLPQVLNTFYNKWNHLANLNVLKVIFFQDCDPQNFTLQFLRCWLKQLNNTIQTLFVELSPDSIHSLWGDIPKQGKFDFSVFFESIQHLKNSLEVLTISDKSLLYSIENLPDHSFEFNNIREFSLVGFMSEEKFDTFRLFQTNLRDRIIQQTEQQFKIILGGLKFDSSDVLLNFIRSFDEEDFIKRNLKIQLETNLKPEPSEIFGHDFECLHLSCQNFSVEIIVNCKESFLSDSVVESLKEGFQFLNFSSIL